MINTLPLDKLKKDSKTIYEAVEVISKRARQINSQRRAQMEVFDTSEETEDNFEELNINIENQLYEKKDKPTRQAINELMGGKLEIKYPDVENKESID